MKLLLVTISRAIPRVDGDTIVSDPKAYTQPIVGQHRIMKLWPKDEMMGEICVPSEEKSFADRIAQPATAKPAK